MIDEAEWNFSKVASGNRDALKVFLWELGRECQSVIDKIELLRDVARKHDAAKGEREIALQLYALTPRPRWTLPSELLRTLPARSPEFLEETGPGVEELRQITRNFSWGLFTSHEFPEKPWFEVGSDCPIRQYHTIWREDLGEPFVRPRLFDFKRFVSDRDWTGTDKLIRDMSELVPRLDPEDYRVYLFGIPAVWFEVATKGEIMKAFNYYFSEMNQQILEGTELPDFNEDRDLRHVVKEKGQNSRAHIKKGLEDIGILRLIRFCSRAELDALASDKPKTSLGKKLRNVSLDATGDSDYRRKVKGILHEFFKIDEEERPRSWQPHPSRAQPPNLTDWRRRVSP